MLGGGSGPGGSPVPAAPRGAAGMCRFDRAAVLPVTSATLFRTVRGRCRALSGDCRGRNGYQLTGSAGPSPYSCSRRKRVLSRGLALFRPGLPTPDPRDRLDQAKSTADVYNCLRVPTQVSKTLLQERSLSGALASSSALQLNYQFL